MLLLTAFYLSPSPSAVSGGPVVPVQTDDGLDPVNLIWTGYAPAWWVVQNMAIWSDTSSCSSPKTILGRLDNNTLERVDLGGLSCAGPRDHVRIWDMGYNAVFGHWSIGAVHHEHAVCSLSGCSHVIDSWENAERDVRLTFRNNTAVESVSNYTLENSENYQGVYNDGNASKIQLYPPSGGYPVTIRESGLPPGTHWSISMDGTSFLSESDTIILRKPNGTYMFAVESPLQESNNTRYVASQVSGFVVVSGSATSTHVDYNTQYYLAIDIAPHSSGSVAPPSNWYDAGSSVTLTANPEAGYKFLSWNGTGTGSYTGTENPATMSLNGPVSETVRFARLPTKPPYPNPQVSNGPGIFGLEPMTFYLVFGVLTVTALSIGLVLGRRKSGSA